MKSYSVAGSVLGWIVFQKQDVIALQAMAIVLFITELSRDIFFFAFRNETLVHCVT